MSETETHKGKLVPLYFEGNTLEDRAREACLFLGLERDTQYHKSWLECLEDEGHEKVFIHNDIIYKIDDQEVDPEGFSEATVNDNGSYDYFISWYNGGASMNEVLQQAVKQADAEKD